MASSHQECSWAFHSGNGFFEAQIDLSHQLHDASSSQLWHTSLPHGSHSAWTTPEGSHWRAFLHLWLIVSAFQSCWKGQPSTPVSQGLLVSLQTNGRMSFFSGTCCNSLCGKSLHLVSRIWSWHDHIKNQEQMSMILPSHETLPLLWDHTQVHRHGTWMALLWHPTHESCGHIQPWARIDLICLGDLQECLHQSNSQVIARNGT